MVCGASSLNPLHGPGSTCGWLLSRSYLSSAWLFHYHRLMWVLVVFLALKHSSALHLTSLSRRPWVPRTYAPNSSLSRSQAPVPTYQQRPGRPPPPPPPSSRIRRPMTRAICPR